MGVNGDRSIWLIFWFIVLARPLYHFCTVHIHLLTVLFYTSRPSTLRLQAVIFSLRILWTLHFQQPQNRPPFWLNDCQLQFIIVHFDSSDRSLYSLLVVHFGGDSIHRDITNKNSWREKLSHFYQYFVPTLVMPWLIVFSFSDFHKHVQEGASLMIIQFC